MCIYSDDLFKYSAQEILLEIFWYNAPLGVTVTGLVSSQKTIFLHTRRIRSQIYYS